MDHITDQNPMQMYGTLIAVGDAVPDYVLKTASYTEDNVATLHAKYFADSVNRELPLHTKAATYLSAAYFYSAGDKNSLVDARIKKASKLFGIDSDIDVLREASTKEATQGPVHALVLEHPATGDMVEMFRVDTPDFLIKSANDLVESHQVFNLTRTNFVKAARVMAPLIKVSGCADLIPESVIRAGIPRTPNFKIARSVAYKQAGANTGLLSTLNDIIDSAETMYTESLYDVSTVDKWAAVWEEFSKEAGVDLPAGMDSYTAFFSGQSEEAAEKEASAFVVIRDVLIPADVIKTADTKLIDVAFTAEDATLLKTACAETSSNDMTKAFSKLSSSTQKRFLKHIAEQAK